MTYEKRLLAAMRHAGFWHWDTDKPYWASMERRVREVLPPNHPRKKDFKGTLISIYAGRGRKRKTYPSEYNLWFALACEVNPPWLASEKGPMTGDAPTPPQKSARRAHPNRRPPASPSAYRTRRIFGIVALMASLVSGFQFSPPAKADLSYTLYAMVRCIRRKRAKGLLNGPDNSHQCHKHPILSQPASMPV